MKKREEVYQEFVSIASHELKTPVTLMLLSFQSLLKKMEKNPDRVSPQEIKKTIIEAEFETKKLTKIITNLLDISTIRSEGLKLQKRKLNLTNLTKDVVGKFKKQYPDISLTISGNIYAKADPLRVEQILNNLLSNAIKYGRLRPIKVSLKKLSKSVKITVEDRGIGIKKKHLEQIFEKFERAVAANSTYQGFGMGLYITRMIVEAHKGKIIVKSLAGKGSTFTVTLPTK